VAIVRGSIGYAKKGNNMHVKSVLFQPDEVIEALREYASRKEIEFKSGADIIINEVGDDGTIVLTDESED